MPFYCIVSKEEGVPAIDVTGERGEILGRFEIIESSDDYGVKRLEKNDKWEGVISPLGIRFARNESVGEKILLVYADGSKREILYPREVLGDDGNNEYLFRFSEVEDVEKIVEVVMKENEKEKRYGLIEESDEQKENNRISD